MGNIGVIGNGPFCGTGDTLANRVKPMRSAVPGRSIYERFVRDHIKAIGYAQLREVALLIDKLKGPTTRPEIADIIKVACAVYETNPKELKKLTQRTGPNQLRRTVVLIACDRYGYAAQALGLHITRNRTSVYNILAEAQKELAADPDSLFSRNVRKCDELLQGVDFSSHLKDENALI
jgi:hypothetical protein